MRTRGGRAVLPSSWIIVAFCIVAIVSTVVAFAIWLISRVVNVDAKITEELGEKVVEIVNKRVPRPFRFLVVAPPAGQLGVLNKRLAGRDWVMGADYSIADISLVGWVRNLIGFYEARELVCFDRFLRVQAWLDRGLARPAVQRGLEVTAA